MSGRPDIAWSRQLAGTSPGQVSLWALAAMLMLSAHAGAAWWAMQERPTPVAQDAAPAIMVDLASVPMAPAAVEEQVAMDEVDSMAAEAVETTEIAEPVDQPDMAEPVEPLTEAEAVPMEPVETVEPEPVEEVPVETAMAAEAVEPEPVEPVVEPEVTTALAETVEPEMLEPVEDIVEPRPEAVIPIPQARPEPQRQVARQERPREQTRPRQQQPTPSRQQTRAQTQAAQPAPRAAAPQASSGAGSSVSPARWQSQVHARISRQQRRNVVQRAGRTGTAVVRFSIDARGNVLSASLGRSSGVPVLDEEAVSMVRRASPVPTPPPNVARTISVPITFTLR